MSDSVNVSTERPCGVSPCRGQDRPGGVSVSSVGVAAGPALESSLRQRHAVLGSRPALAARHRCVGGRHYHHRSACPQGVGNQFAFSLPGGVIGCLTRHRGLEQELGAEVFHRDQMVARHDAARPLPRRVLALPGDFLVHNGGLPLCLPIAARRFLAGFGFASGHAALVGDQFLCRCFGIFGCHEVELRLGAGGDGGHAPVDTDRAVDLGKRPVGDAYDEAGVPVPKRILVDAHAGWFGRQLPRPHHRDQPTPSQPQPTVLNAESVAGVFQTRQSFLRMLETAPALARERAKRLLLRGHRTGGQPRQRGTGRSQVLTADMRAAILARPSLCQALIPNPPGPIPLAHQRTLGLRWWAQPVVETQHRRYSHHTNIFDRSDNSRRRHMQQATANGHPYLPIAKARGISGGFR